MPAVLLPYWRRVRFAGLLATSSIACSLPIIASRFLGLIDRVAPPILTIWARSWFTGACIRVETEGADRLALAPRGAVLVGNHQSSLDIPLLMTAAQGRIKFFAKRILFWIPFAGWTLWATRSVAVDRGNARRTRESMDAAFAALAGGLDHIVVFPEGTRSLDGEMLPYRRGTFNFAKRTGAPIIPFALDGTGVLMPKGRFTAVPGPVRLIVGEPIPPEEAATLDPDALMARCRAFTETALARLRATPLPA